MSEIKENPESMSPKNDKEIVPGIIYISFIPPNMTPFHIKQIFEKYGDVGRIFLQPEDNKFGKKKRKAKYNSGRFTEGWVEMSNKRIAKRLALTLNNTLMEDGKKMKFKDHTWNVKYLHRFRWGHLNERLVQEKQIAQQRLRVEQSQARRESAAFVANIGANKRNASIKERKRKKGIEVVDKKLPQFKQRKTVETLEKEKKDKSVLEPRTEVLSKIFG